MRLSPRQKKGSGAQKMGSMQSKSRRVEKSQKPVSAVATCADGLEEVLAAELEKLGAEEIEPGYRSVTFSCSEADYYRCHLELRTAGRLQRILRSVSAGESRILFDKARRLPWKDWLDPDKPLAIDANSAQGGNSKISVSDVGSKIREAIQDHFQHHRGRAVNKSSYGAVVSVCGHLKKNRCAISISTHGDALHKRGYREPGHPATLKENLAAAILMLADYQGDQPLVDICCGSGTLAIEAALIAKNQPPGLKRPTESFGLSHLANFDSGLWQKIQKSSKARMRKPDPEVTILANDLDADALGVAGKCAQRAGVDEICFHQGDMLKLKRPKTSKPGLLVGNLPYDERLAAKDLESLYRSLGLHFKKEFAGWKAAMLVAAESPWKSFGLKPTKRYSLKNGTIPVKLLIFDLYSGSRN